MRFSITVEGCAEAREWLIKTNQYHLFESPGHQDGYSLVHLANTLWEKQNGKPSGQK